MGEVYRGYDERLDRTIALKRISPGARDPDESRERFRREARMAARVGHPSIVQVHDWLEEQDELWIVMEYVEGRPLGELMEDGPLSIEQAARLTRGLAAGLSAAHVAGVVHRDLKPGNLLITPEGDAKILDFGLAKRTGQGLDHMSISKSGQILGTVRYMSPEQALGQSVDHRTDLFSLGVLLYEMLTCTSPFGGDQPVETLSRICTFHPPAVSDRRGDCPPALSRLVDALLEKERERRPQSADEVVQRLDEIFAPPSGSSPSMGSVGFTGGGLAADGSRSEMSRPGATPQAPADLPTVLEGRNPAGPATTSPTSIPMPSGQVATDPPPTHAVPKRRSWAPWALGAIVAALIGLSARWAFDVSHTSQRLYIAVPLTQAVGDGDLPTSLELVTNAVHNGISRSLLTFDDIAVVEPSAADADTQGHVNLARALGVEEVLDSRVSCSPASCQIQLKRFHGTDGRLLESHAFTTDTWNLLDLSLLVGDQLRTVFPEVKRDPNTPDLRVRPHDYETFLRLEEAYWSHAGTGSTDAVLDGLRALQETSPRFVEAVLLESAVARRRFQLTRDPAAWELGAAAVERALELSPDDPRVLKSQALLNLAAGNLDQAGEVLDRIAAIEPGDVEQMAQRAELLERRGQLEESHALMRKAVARQPWWGHYLNLADMEYRAGNIDAARQAMESALERSPGNYEALSRLAQLELLNGLPARAVELYEPLVERAGDEAELTNLGVALLLMKRYDEAAIRFRQALERAPSSPFALLNLADAEFLRGHHESAGALYDQVIEQVARDPDPDALLTVRAQAEAHRGRYEEAVAAVQQALRLAPDNPQTLYEAALVYALAGDDVSAAWNARQALDRGLEPRWFTFPWFDSLRPRLDLTGDPVLASAS